MSEHQRSLLKPAIYHHTPPASSFSTYTPTPSSSDHQHSQTTKAPHKDHPKYTSAPTNHKTIHHRPRDRQLPNSKKNSEAKTRPKLRKDSGGNERAGKQKHCFYGPLAKRGINRALLNWKLRGRCMEREFQQRGLVLEKRNMVVSFRECLPRLGL